MLDTAQPIKQNIISSFKNSSYLKELATQLETGSPFVIEMTPDMADAILAISNTFNRIPTPAKVRSYTKAMVSGEWQYNGDPIRFYEKDYKLADGQHRLHAISQSKTTQQCLIVPGIEHKAYLTIDCGKNRSARDAFQMMNHSNPGEKATCCIIALKWMVGKQIRSIPTPTNTQILEFERTHTLAITEAVKFCVSLQTEYGKLLNPGNVASALVIDYLHRGELDVKFTKFLEAFWSKSYDSKEEPVFQLIRLIDRHSQARNIKQGKLSLEGVIASILRAYKLHRTGKVCTNFNDIMFPARKSEPFSAVL